MKNNCLVSLFLSCTDKKYLVQTDSSNSWVSREMNLRNLHEYLVVRRWPDTRISYSYSYQRWIFFILWPSLPFHLRAGSVERSGPRRFPAEATNASRWLIISFRSSGLGSDQFSRAHDKWAVAIACCWPREERELCVCVWVWVRECRTRRCLVRNKAEVEVVVLFVLNHWRYSARHCTSSLLFPFYLVGLNVAIITSIFTYLTKIYLLCIF